LRPLRCGKLKRIDRVRKILMSEIGTLIYFDKRMPYGEKEKDK